MGSFITSILGSSPRTSLTGYVIAILGIVYTVIQAGGIPQTKAQWLQFAGSVLMGVLGYFSKDSNVSNAKSPLPDSQPVPPA